MSQCGGLLDPDAFIDCFIGSGFEVVSEKSGDDVEMKMEDVLTACGVVVLTK